MTKKTTQTNLQAKKAEKLFAAAIKAEDEGKFEKAQLLYEQSIQADKNSFASRLRLAGLLWGEQHKYKEAIKITKLIVKRWPQTMAYSILGNSYMKLGRFVQAEKTWRQSLAIEATPEAYFFLGFTLTELNRDDEAIACYKKAIKLDPNYDEAHYNLGCRYKLQGQYTLAEKHLRKAIAIDSKYARAYAELGMVLLKGERDEGKIKVAVRLLQKSIRLDPNYGWPHVYLANALWRLRRRKAADAQYRKVIELWPHYSLSYWAYGGFLADLWKDSSLAESYLRKAVELDPQDEVANYWLGKSLLKWNRKSEAKKYLKKAMRLGYETAAILFTNTYPPSRILLIIPPSPKIDRLE